MSKREIVLNALFERLSTLDVTVKRNDLLPQKIPDGGLVILRDGNVGEPEILLSPTCYIFTHRAELEVIVQKETPAERDQTLDNLLVQIGELLQEDPQLGGEVDFMHADPPEFVDEVIDGGVTIKGAIVPIVLEYTSNSNLI
ncbi:MAG: acyl-CoA transferase [Alphaproteobacteria bacterium]|nr:acyl-CoA transferase [Alphaproteobacteria bacterium]